MEEYISLSILSSFNKKQNKTSNVNNSGHLNSVSFWTLIPFLFGLLIGRILFVDFKNVL